MRKKLQFPKKWVLPFLFMIGNTAYGQVWTETFEDSSPTSSGWVYEYIAGTNTLVSGNFWKIAATTSVGYYGSTGPYQGAKMAAFDTRSHARDAVAKFISPVIDLSGVSNPKLDFYYRNMIWGSDQNILKIYYRTSSTDPWVEIKSFNTNEPTWVNSGAINLPNPTATYQIALEGIAKYGYGLDVDDLKIEAIQLGTSEAGTKMNITVSPNPFKDVLNISNVDNVKTITIMDASGRLVKTIERVSSTVNLSDLKEGLYLVNLSYKDGKSTSVKVIKK